MLKQHTIFAKHMCKFFKEFMNCGKFLNASRLTNIKLALKKRLHSLLKTLLTYMHFASCLKKSLKNYYENK